MKLKRIAAFALLTFAIAAPVATGAVLDELNETRVPGIFYWAHPSGKYGWYYTVPEDIELSAINTKLNTSGFNINNSFTLTTAIYTDRPAAGGTLIDSYSWDATGYGGGWTGGSFASPVILTGGTTVFIGFSGWEQVLTGSGGGGVNWTDPVLYPPGSTFDNLYPAYTGAQWETVIDTGSPANFDMAILQFVGEFPSTSAVPEPASFALLFGGLGVLAGLRRLRA